MEIIEQIRRHPLYQEYYGKLEKLEEKRTFCRHQMGHFLDVARIAYIHNLESEYGIRKEVIYAAALLHDIGKARQYTEGIAHEEASAELAGRILWDMSREGDFSEEERQEILRAILGHRKKREGMSVLEELLYTSDKQSRPCFMCPAERECNWNIQKKNLEVEI